MKRGQAAEGEILVRPAPVIASSDTLFLKGLRERMIKM
jgi:hypothetical protein